MNDEDEEMPWFDWDHVALGPCSVIVALIFIIGVLAIAYITETF